LGGGSELSTVIAYQTPPITGLLSKTRILSNTCSLTNASVAMAPLGPAPITATLETLIGIVFCTILNSGVDDGEYLGGINRFSDTSNRTTIS